MFKIILKHNTKLRACGIERCKGSSRLHSGACSKKISTPACRSASRRHGSPSTNPHASGSIFLRQPLHLSIRSRVIALCLNISFVSASVAGGCRSVFGLASGHSCLLFGPLASKRFSSGSCGLRLQFQSSLFRGLFLTNRRLATFDYF